VNIIEAIKALADIAILPLLGVLWNIQGRLSKIEGILTPKPKE